MRTLTETLTHIENKDIRPDTAAAETAELLLDYEPEDPLEPLQDPLKELFYQLRAFHQGWET